LPKNPNERKESSQKKKKGKMCSSGKKRGVRGDNIVENGLRQPGTRHLDEKKRERLQVRGGEEVIQAINVAIPCFGQKKKNVAKRKKVGNDVLGGVNRVSFQVGSLEGDVG